MKRMTMIRLMVALAMSVPLTASVWIAAGPRGFAEGGGSAAWDNGESYAHGTEGDTAVWNHDSGAVEGPRSDGP